MKRRKKTDMEKREDGLRRQRLIRRRGKMEKQGNIWENEGRRAIRRDLETEKNCTEDCTKKGEKEGNRGRSCMKKKVMAKEKMT